MLPEAKTVSRCYQGLCSTLLQILLHMTCKRYDTAFVFAYQPCTLLSHRLDNFGLPCFQDMNKIFLHVILKTKSKDNAFEDDQRPDDSLQTLFHHQGIGLLPLATNLLSESMEECHQVCRLALPRFKAKILSHLRDMHQRVIDCTS